MAIEPNKGGRPPRHGVHQLAQQLGLGRPSGGSAIAYRTRRALNRLQRALDADPIGTIRDHLVDGIACDTIIEQRANRELLASPTLREEQGLAKFKCWVGNRLDRQRDQLLQLERLRAAKDVPSLDEYIAAKAASASATAATVAETPAAPADAASASVCGEEPQP